MLDYKALKYLFTDKLAELLLLKGKERINIYLSHTQSTYAIYQYDYTTIDIYNFVDFVSEGDWFIEETSRLMHESKINSLNVILML